MSTNWYELVGLTPLQADSIIAIMENGGSATAPQIIETLSQTQKVNRTSIYSVLKTLERRGLVKDEKEGKNSIYTLVSTRPDSIIHLLQQSQQDAIETFSKKLKEAKMVASKSGIETEFYGLKRKSHVLSQIDSLIFDSTQYITIMANAPVLSSILPVLEAKIADYPDLTVLIQPTWDPEGNASEFSELLNTYRDKFGGNSVAKPLTIFDNLIAMTGPMFSQTSTEMLEIMQSTNFVQIISEAGMVISTYFDHEIMHDQGGSGIYSREALISQNYLVIFLSIFRDHNPDFEIEDMKQIISNRMSKWFSLVESLLT